MAVKAIKPAPVEVTLEIQTQLSPQPPQSLEAPGGLYPMIARSFIMDEYRLMSGWPVSVPDFDIHARSMVSASGDVLSDREPPTNISTNALVRWVADSDYFNETTLKWEPMALNQVRTPWTFSVPSAPDLITEYEYRIENERFYLPALNFDSDAGEFLRADFTSAVGASGYTVIFVMSPNSVHGNNDTVPYNGLWSHDGADPYWMDVTIQGGYLYLETESKGRTRAISITPHLNDNRPMYLAIVFDRPNVTFYVAEGPASMRVKSMPTGMNTPTPLDPSVILGAASDLTHTADMALFDLSLYADRLSAAEVVVEFSKLAQAYGGDS